MTESALLRIWSHLLKKSFKKNFIFCEVTDLILTMKKYLFALIFIWLSLPFSATNSNTWNQHNKFLFHSRNNFFFIFSQYFYPDKCGFRSIPFFLRKINGGMNIYIYIYIIYIILYIYIYIYIILYIYIYIYITFLSITYSSWKFAGCRFSLAEL